MEKDDVPVVEIFNGSHKKSLIPQRPNPVKDMMEYDGIGCLAVRSRRY